MTLEFWSFPTVQEAATAAKEAGAAYIGGGTLVVRAVNEGDVSITRYVRSNDPGLSRIELDGGQVTLGASVTMSRIASDERLGFIAAAARAVGGPAIRNMATVGGNLFAPSPYGDFATALVALKAELLVGRKWVGIDDFLAARESSADIVSAVRFRLPEPGVLRFLKVSRIKPKGVAVLTLAAVLRTGADGRVSHASIALGGMADRPMRAKAAEGALTGATLTAEGIASAVAVVGEGTDPPTDALASSWYRREVLPVHFRRLLLS
ncbi:MAG: oxidoreductase [Cereibacter sphaeroides]|uniref:Oxidoreductase n=1 Tax=Cereibacter sphaeroides TaxID=1063 RepID=A0A2W5S4V5_CERSP|nr:MAG: oxidoreductase [Cereibacter sphaeroides]